MWNSLTVHGSRHVKCYSYHASTSTCMDTNMQLTINSFRQLFPDKIFSPDISLIFSKISDISLTAVKFPDISTFSRQVVTLYTGCEWLQRRHRPLRRSLSPIEVTRTPTGPEGARIMPSNLTSPSHNFWPLISWHPVLTVSPPLTSCANLQQSRFICFQYNLFTWLTQTNGRTQGWINGYAENIMHASAQSRLTKINAFNRFR